jgi:hypothetical protein
MAHPLGQVGFYRFQYKVVMVTHLTVAMYDKVETRTDLAKYVEPHEAVGIGAKNVFLAVATGGDVVQRAGKF